MTNPKKIHHQQQSNIGLANAGLFYALRTRKHQSLSLQKSKPEIIRKWCVLGDGLICATGLFLYRSTNLCNIQ
ncbi:hypothetical protein CDU00_21110 [Cronobacter sakazakii]|nr:hypothetical protein CDU00_21110 [Cronobacter sakazakii]